MRKLKLFAATLTVAVLGVFALVAPTAQVNAAGALDDVCSKQTTSTSVCDNKDAKPADVINVIVNTLLFIVGAVAVVMIIVGGIRYATSGGNAASVTAAKNTILYSVIGLVVAILAFAIVNWVMNYF